MLKCATINSVVYTSNILYIHRIICQISVLLKIEKKLFTRLLLLACLIPSVELCGDLGGNQHHIYHQMRSTQTSSKYFYLLPTKKPMKKHIIYHSRVNGITGLTSIDASVTSTNSLSRPLSCGSESIPNEFAFHGHH